jgi:hypothetical protein
MMSVAAADHAREFSASRALWWLAAFFAYGLGLSVLYALTGIGLPCPFRWLTGWDCPLCGATRMGSALLRLDPATAFAQNPVVLIGLAVLTALAALWTVELLGGPAVRPPEPLRAALRQVRPGHWLLLGLALALVSTLLRNLG